jgi:predicted TPR repeat methyltransferase
MTEVVTEPLEIALPPSSTSLSQDEEWCVVYWKGEWQKILVHDYEAIFGIPGLYEQLIYEILDCRSPTTVRQLLEQELARVGQPPEGIRALDLGAGNGMVAEELVDMGAESVIGIDIIDAAAEAARRDRPGVYEDFHVIDMTELSEGDRRRVGSNRPNCLITVAALGFGDIPPAAFRNAFDLIQPGGWIVFNIKEEFLEQGDGTGFSRLVQHLESNGTLRIQTRKRYQHRLGTDGTPIHYLAVVGRKMPVPQGGST